MKITTRLMACAVTLAIASGSLLGCTTPGEPDPGPGPAPGGGGGGGAIGPNPTDSMLEANRGPHAITDKNVNGPGFNDGTLHYPTDASLGKLGAMVIVPGFLSGESSVRWWGPRIASHGFVVLTIATNTALDFPGARARQLDGALDWMVKSSPVADRIDPTRLAAGGWSMGGGASLDAARTNKNIKAIVPMAPWNPASRYSFNTPTFILSCSTDLVAGNSSNSDAFYRGLSGEKAQLTISGGHFCPTSRHDGAAKLVVAWLKRFVDNDTRYSRFVCGSAPLLANYRNTCPV